MKKISLAFVAVMGMFSTSAMADAGCGKLSDYQVPKMSFSKLPLDEALSRMVKGMPYQIAMQDKTGKVVTANDVEGPLDLVLTELAKSAKFTYETDRCILKITPLPPEKIKPVWLVKQGDSVMNTLLSWTSTVGWQLVWDIKGDFTFGSNSQLTGEFEDAVTDLIGIINTDQRGLRADLYSGNKVLRISTNAEGGVK